MDEFFLQYLWRHQKLTTHKLVITSGEKLSVYHPGVQNEDAGPDFSEARLKIGTLNWYGAVEVHYKSSDWFRHGHENDPRYQNVILHVVWSADREVYTPDGKPIPVLELSHYVPENLDLEYQKYINQPDTIRCAHNLQQIKPIYVASMLDKAFAERLKEKTKRVISIAKSCDHDWEETAYRILARSFGFNTNSEPFERLAESLPYKILKKHLNQPQMVEALLFGQAGFLEHPKESYAASMQNDYNYLARKYRLVKVLSEFHWKFSKMRPAGFPTVRIAQFHAMILGNQHLFNHLISLHAVSGAIHLIKKPLAAYWEKHYNFGKATKKTYAIGDASIENIIINAVVPILGAYAKHVDNVSLLERAEKLLEQMKSEDNKYTRKWKDAGIVSRNAKDSQALLYQYQHYCKRKRCLQCSIGISIIGT